MAKKKELIWFIPEEFTNAYLLMASNLAEDFVYKFPKWGMGNYFKNVFAEFKNFYIRFGFVRGEFDQGCEFLASKMMGNPKWAKAENAKIIFYANKAEKIAQEILKKNLTGQSSAGLMKLFQQLETYKEELHGRGVATTWLADAERESYSNKIRQFLADAITRNKVKLNPVSVFSILTTPFKLTLADKEELEILEIAKLINKNQKSKKIISKINPGDVDLQIKVVDPKLWRIIDNFYQRYCWLVYVYTGPTNTKEYYYSLWQSLLRQKADISKLQKEIIEKKDKTKNQQQEILKKLKLNSKQKRQIEVAQQMVWLKAWRKDIMSLIFYTYEKILKELGKRYGLSFNQVRMCYPREINQRFLSKKDVADILNKRINHCLSIYLDGKEKFIVGQEVDKILAKLRFEKVKVENVNELTGSCAYEGKVRGRVKIIFTPEEMGKMEKGDILVSHSTNPNILSAMIKASAIITNAGGLTCHAAIVAREFKIPCVIGTKIATKVLKDGDMVEVDAQRGIVRKITK